jgi:adenosylhomocysteine nucleosidase
MKILVTFAVAAEFAAWRRRGGFRQIGSDPFPVYAAAMGGSTVRVLLTGIGTVSAAEALTWALASPTDLCISSGFAGALRPGLGVGEILVARLVRRGQRDLAVASDRDLMAAACDAGAHQVDRFLTSEAMVVQAEEKLALADEADAVEMETFVILAEAARHGVRAVAVRAASDTAQDSLPYGLDRALGPRGQVRVGALAAVMARQPHRIPALLRLARDCRTAAWQLARFLDEYVGLLDSRFDLSQSEAVAVT